MKKVKHISTSHITKLTGGRDPLTIVQDFIRRRGFDSFATVQKKTNDIVTWSVDLGFDEELEITLEGLSNISETTLYMGINIMSIPLNDIDCFLIAALNSADTLIGAKLSLVNYDLVISVTEYASELTTEIVDYIFELINRQKPAIKEAIVEQFELES